MDAYWIITAFVVIDTLMERLGHRSDVRAKVPDSEILTIAVVAAKYCGNHHERAVQIMKPKKKPRNGTLTPQEKEENRRISSVRVRIEHVIGDIKRYRIVHDIIRFSCSEFRDMVMETCCGLHNFRIWLKRKKQSENQNKS